MAKNKLMMYATFAALAFLAAIVFACVIFFAIRNKDPVSWISILIFFVFLAVGIVNSIFAYKENSKD